MSRTTVSPVTTRLQRARRGHAQIVHGFTAQKLTHRRAQHRRPSAVANRAFARPLELQLRRLPAAAHTSLREIARPSPSSPAQGPNWCRHNVPRRAASPGRTRLPPRTSTAAPRDAGARCRAFRPPGPPRRAVGRPHRGRLDPRIAGVAHLPGHIMRRRIARQLAHEAIIERTFAQIGEIGGSGRSAAVALR